MYGIERYYDHYVIVRKEDNSIVFHYDSFVEAERELKELNGETEAEAIIDNNGRNYTVYHLHSDLSNGVTNIDSVTKYKQYVEHAKSLGMKALAFAEHGNIFEWVHKKESIEAAGMKYIHAAEVYLTTDTNAEDKHRDNYHCVLIAKNYDGVKELNKLISNSFNRDDFHYYYAPRIGLNELFATSDNIIITTACFRKGTPVLTTNGYIPIENIKSGDVVVNRYGQQEVVNFPTQRHYVGDGYRINFVGGKSIECTSNHEFLTYKLNKKELQWVSAEELNVKRGSEKHICVLPITLTKYSNKNIIYKNEWDGSFFNNSNKHKKYRLPEEIKITPELMRLFGLFLGDGCISLKVEPRIGFTFNIDEYEVYWNSFVKKATEQLGIEWQVSYRRENNRVDITSSSRELINLFYYLFGDVDASNKDIPKRLKHISKDLDIELFFGYMLADGYFRQRYSKSINANHSEFVAASISKKLIDDMGEILDSLHISYGIRKSDKHIDKKGVNHKDSWYLYSKAYDIGCISKLNTNSHLDIIQIFNNAIQKFEDADFITFNNILYKKVRLKNKELIKLNETVYCLNNNSHSFVCNGLVVHNCLGGVLNKADNDIKTQFLRFLIKNKHRCYLEIQHHNCEDQATYNKILYTIHQKTNIPLIAGTDTHCLNDTHVEGRSILQKGKNVFFSDEEAWDLTFKTYDELVNAYRNQRALPEEVYLEAIENTNRMADSIEEFKLDYNKKYPKLYNDSEKVLKEKILKGIKNRGVDKYENFDEYKKKIQYELETYKHNGAIDFLLLEEDYKSALKKQGVSCGYSRGSVSGSEIAYLLGITEVDSIKYNLNFERFMNKERVSLADVDTDWSKKDRYKVREYLFNKEGLYCCDIITFNTIALKGAIKDVGRALGLSVDETQTISDAVYLDENKKDCIDDFYLKKYPELFKYVDIVKGTIVSIGNHPAGLVVSPYPVDEWFGLCSTKSNENMISQINMKEIDGLSFVKLDVLGLDCVGLINETCDLAGIPRLTPDNISFDDKKVWDEIRDDCTMIFQFESSYAGDYIKQLFSDDTIANIKEKNKNFSYIDLMSMANGAIRPAGASYRDELSTGKYHDNGHEALNKFLAPTLGYLVYQEQIIEFLHSFCGYTMGEADIVRRGFAKKTGTDKFIPKIKEGFIKTMKEKYNVEEDESNKLIESFIQVIIDASSYLFSLNHATPYSFLGYVVGWLRCYYKLETVTTALNIYEDDSDKCLEILQYAKKHGIELKPIKFSKSGSFYTIDKENNAIYKGISSIKYCNAQIANELLELSKNHYDTFTDLLKDIKEKTSLNSRQLHILTGLNFFSEFGNNKYLLNVIEVYDKFASAKIIAKKKMEELGVTEFLMEKYAGKETKSQYRDLDNQGLIKELCGRLSNDSMGVVEQVKFEMEYLEYTTYVNPDFADYYYIVLNFRTMSDPTKPYFTLRNIKTGEEIQTKIKQSKLYKEDPFGEYAILDIKGFTYKYKKKNVGGEWIETSETEPIVTEYEVIKNG